MVDGIDEPNLKSITLQVEGVDCSCEVNLLERKLKSLKGVSDFHIDVVSKHVKVSFDPSQTSPQDIIRSVSEAGVACSMVKERRQRSTWWKDRQQLALYGCGIITLFSFFLMTLGAQEIVTNSLFGIAVLVGVYYPARKAIIALVNLVATIHLLMLIGATGAVLLGMWYEAAILIFVYSLGDVLESYAVDKARGAIRSLTELVPKKALVRKDGEEMVMSTEEIGVGNIVIVRPGERIPVDGKISQGLSYIDQAAVTGE